MGTLRRLDHVAVLVRDTAEALEYFSNELGLTVVCSDEVPVPPVRLTYLDAGNAYLQLVEPLESDSWLTKQIEGQGEGLHHICFGVDDVEAAVDVLSGGNGADATIGSGRGRKSAFVPGELMHGVRVECTEFRHEEDVTQSPGFLS